MGLWTKRTIKCNYIQNHACIYCLSNHDDHKLLFWRKNTTSPLPLLKIYPRKITKNDPHSVVTQNLETAYIEINKKLQKDWWKALGKEKFKQILLRWNMQNRDSLNYESMITLRSRAQNEAIAPPIEWPVTMMRISP